ncbi:BrnA antitoxin family protein [Aliirhizobium terrae]|uniref:BrnA antitoxin family protein n=1 Tax=Terrirhizobium terrae TaxID=2926709 RepID=UPI0025788FD1|nr:BrnA antitoxin family protein [Rhizobium sp. CC-CFT758]WJH39080.1 BrnA antitoxin family protein [Rhizobium sp. CC-CFT758]
MTDHDIRKASLSDLRAMKEAGKLEPGNAASDGEDLGPDFWSKADLSYPEKRSVHLKIDQDVFDFFYSDAKGKGHLTKMQNVLRAYVAAKKAAGSR